ncbi:hypothetical protein ACFL35_12580 [Candidatus Riflebacteria bacterium]
MRSLYCERFLAYALSFSCLFLLVYLAGFREYTLVFSGTSGGSGWVEFFGLIYIFLYLAFVVIVPILLLASLLVETIAFFLQKDTVKIEDSANSR